MKAIKLAAGLTHVVILVICSTVIVQHPGLIDVQAHQTISKPSTRGIFRGINPVRKTFPIADTWEIEPFSAVANGGDHQVVVYVKENGDGLKSINAAVITEQDEEPNPYPISNHTHHCGHPAIAYHASSGFFMVLYTHQQMDIYAQLFSPLSGKIGPAVLISDDEVQKGFPAIACNQLDGVCLAVYQQNGTHIKGRYLEVVNGEIINLSAIYDLASGMGVDQPRLAWGRGVGTFLLTYNERIASGEVRPSYKHLQDRDDTQGVEKLHQPGVPVLPVGSFTAGHDAFVKDAVFDPCTEKFVLMIEYDAAGDGENFDLWAAVLHAREPITNGTFPIADSPVSEQGGAIQFIDADQETYVCGNRDRLVVAYINADVGLMATELRGNNNSSDPSYAIDSISQHLLIENHTNMFVVSSATLSNSAKNGQVLVVYERFFSSSEAYELWGQFLAVRFLTYLPLVMR